MNLKLKIEMSEYVLLSFSFGHYHWLYSYLLSIQVDYTTDRELQIKPTDKKAFETKDTFALMLCIKIIFYINMNI